MKKLKLYYTSDVHGYVFPTDYRDKQFKNMGFLQLTGDYKKDENTIIIDGGDTVQGSPFTTFISKQNLTTHPYCSVINNFGYDYVVLGNHDFNYGYDYLMSYLQNLKAKVLTANVIDKKDNALIFPYDIKTLDNGLRVGIIGLTTDYINVWEKPENLINFEILDSYATLQKYFKKVKDNCDILVAVYHGGFENDLDNKQKLSDTSENIAYKICEDFDIDILLTGHQHMAIIDRYVCNTYIAQTPANGTKYAEIDVEFKHNSITKIDGQLKTATIKQDYNVSNELVNLDKQVQQWLDKPVGYLDTALKPDSHLSMALNGTLLANFFNQVQLKNCNADIACTSFANSIKGFSKEVTVRDIVSTYIYPNTLIVKEVSGKILKLALERCASYFENNNGEISVSSRFLKPKIEHYNYDHYANLNYVFDLTKDVGNRVVSIKFKNKEVKENDVLKLVMNNYRSSGTGGYDFFKDLKVVEDIQIDMTELIINEFLENKIVIVDKTKYLKVIK
ncbi:bifunctional metallophosphatase/5'-nucleotidase [Clostridium sp. 'deep sea']|uniref:bifunctional metallophosphatase/5'-nucleotidase n=1 Tax=Clostridium sp. 'deep sea' TaxID=2779445 RepID=UPI00189673E6|nr:bifunctional UDP-sugar hydrolase/5'-nucleotidase [Clostridium sp. 'deep sea']QOR34395.1 bifunctional metallophosphatase/5'-nucleotidase [Clostridium sp. 'deep sea']